VDGSESAVIASLVVHGFTGSRVDATLDIPGKIGDDGLERIFFSTDRASLAS